MCAQRQHDMKRGWEETPISWHTDHSASHCPSSLISRETASEIHCPKLSWPPHSHTPASLSNVSAQWMTPPITQSWNMGITGQLRDGTLAGLATPAPQGLEQCLAAPQNSQQMSAKCLNPPSLSPYISINHQALPILPSEYFLSQLCNLKWFTVQICFKNRALWSNGFQEILREPVNASIERDRRAGGAWVGAVTPGASDVFTKWLDGRINAAPSQLLHILVRNPSRGNR